MLARAVECLFFTWLPLIALIWTLELMILGRFLP